MFFFHHAGANGAAPPGCYLFLPVVPVVPVVLLLAPPAVVATVIVARAVIPAPVITPVAVVMLVPVTVAESRRRWCGRRWCGRNHRYGKERCRCNANRRNHALNFLQHGAPSSSIRQRPPLVGLAPIRIRVIAPCVVLVRRPRSLESLLGAQEQVG